jgi:ABC-type multidrug transport system fused ATPase/permease subunit
MYRCIEGESESEHCIDNEHEMHTDSLRGADGGPPCGPLEGDIEFRNIVFRFPSNTSTQQALSQGSAPFTLCIDSLFIPMGQHLAIVGPKGSGKTTLMNLLLRLHDPSDGVIYYEGQDSRNLDPSWLRSNIGCVHVCICAAVEYSTVQ